MRQRQDKCRAAAGQVSDLPAVLLVLLFFALFPLVNLLSAAAGCAAMCLITHQAATRAAEQQTYQQALTVMEDECRQFNQSGFARFIHSVPAGGYQNCGADLYVHATNYLTKATTTFGPDSPVPPPIDSSDFIYEYSCRCTYDIGPFLNLSAVPFILQVEGIGRPMRMTFASCRAAEHPEGLGGAGRVAVAFNAPPAIANTLPSPTPGGAGWNYHPPGSHLSTGGAGWNYPNIYQLIAAQGQMVLSDNVMQVYANNWQWTDTGLTVGPGDKIWIDYRADGEWTLIPPGGPPGGWAIETDADGTRNYWRSGYASPPSYNGYTPGSVLGKIASSIFLMGKQKWNFPPPANGTLLLICNGSVVTTKGGDQTNFASNDGYMTIRVIVSR